MQLFSPVSELMFHLFQRLFLLRCEMMNPCFIISYELTQKLGFIAKDSFEKSSRLFLINCEQIAHSFLMNELSSNIRCTALFHLFYLASSLTHFHPSVIEHYFMGFLDIFWHLVNHCDICLCISYVLSKTLPPNILFVINEGADSYRVDSSLALILV